jgi:hypothetical protein
LLAVAVGWYLMNELRVHMYDGDHGPSEAFATVVWIQEACVLAAALLSPLALWAVVDELHQRSGAGKS